MAPVLTFLIQTDHRLKIEMFGKLRTSLSSWNVKICTLPLVFYDDVRKCQRRGGQRSPQGPMNRWRSIKISGKGYTTKWSPTLRKLARPNGPCGSATASSSARAPYKQIAWNSPATQKIKRKRSTKIRGISAKSLDLDQ
jgi:hypothetical protein